MEVSINGYSFKVKFVDGDIPKMNPDNDQYNLVLVEYIDGIINIRKGLTKRIKRTTVIHELTHAFLFAFGYTVDGEEAICDFFGAQGDEIMRMADMIMKVIEDNKKC